MKKLLDRFKKTTVAAVMASFETTLTELAHVGEYHRNRAKGLEQEMHVKRMERDVSLAEADRAENVSIRLERLLHG